MTAYPGLVPEIPRACVKADVANVRFDVAISKPSLTGFVVTIRVRDDGIGVDPEILARGQRPSHWGLPGMRERSESFGGHLHVWSEGNAGTEVELRIPAHAAYAQPPASISSRVRAFFWLR